MIDLLGMQRAVWRCARTTAEKIVLLAIADFYSDRSPEPWPSVPTLTERCSLGRTAVLEAIAALERDGILVVRCVQSTVSGELQCWGPGLGQVSHRTEPSLRNAWFFEWPLEPQGSNLARSFQLPAYVRSGVVRVAVYLMVGLRLDKESVRRDKSRAVIDKFFDWCDAELLHVLDETPIQAALRSATNQRIALRRFLDDGRLPAHNNIIELNLRRQVLGRRNWLFVGSDDGAAVNTVFVSLLASARLHGIEPHGYLRDLLCLLRAWPSDRLLELAPAYWQKTLEQPETQDKLAANVFRRAVLSPPS